MTSVIFMYQEGASYSSGREFICRKLIDTASTVLSLPDEVQVEFCNLGKSVYGSTSLEYRFRNRIGMNSELLLQEIPAVLVHELIHLHQTYTGILRSNRHGQYFWNNRQIHVPKDISYEEYQRLPWEVDVQERHHKILTEILTKALG